MSRLTSLALGGGGATTMTFGGYSPAGEPGWRSNTNDSYAWTGGVNVNRAYGINGLNQYTSVGGGAIGYDAMGNLASSGTDTFGYNADNLMVTGGGGSFTHDAMRRMVYGSASGTRYAYDGSRLLGEYNSANAMLRRYVYGPGSDEPIIWYEGSGTGDRRFMDGDERGSIVRITRDDGSVMAMNSYDEFGIPAQTNQGRFGYTGQAWMPEVGMYYYKARMYSPTLGRFMQTDPIGYANGPNWYNYASSNPITGTDPTGMLLEIESDSGGGGGGGDFGFDSFNSDDTADYSGSTPDLTGPASFGDPIVVTANLDPVDGLNAADTTITPSYSLTDLSGDPSLMAQSPKPAPQPAYCSSTLYRIGSGISSLGNGIGYVGGAFDVAAAGSFLGSGGVATPGSAALAGVGVSAGILGSAVGVVGNGVKFFAGDQSGSISSVINGLAVGLPLGSSSAKEAFAESVAGFLSDRANDAVSKSPCD